jgi:hypothetical protein
MCRDYRSAWHHETSRQAGERWHADRKGRAHAHVTPG